MKPNILKIESFAPITPTLNMLHEVACNYVEECYAKAGEVIPTFLLQSAMQVAWITAPWESQAEKQATLAIIRHMLGVVGSGYSFVSETWMAAFAASHPDYDKLVEQANSRGVASLPPHLRDDAAYIMTRDRQGNHLVSTYHVTISKVGMNFLGPRVDITEEMTEGGGPAFNLFTPHESSDDALARIQQQP